MLFVMMMMPVHYQTKSGGMVDAGHDRLEATSDDELVPPIDIAMVIYLTQV
jgi:hypothetical protein